LAASASAATLQLSASVPAGVSSATITFKVPGSTAAPAAASIAEGGTTVWTAAKGFVRGTDGIVAAEWSSAHGGVVHINTVAGSYDFLLEL
jgi:hypothetical protein